MKKTVDILIISGASITASPWFTWADILIESLKPKQVINLSARGTGNYWICLSLINSILNISPGKNVLCAAMFTNIDKFDMFLPDTKTQIYQGQKHRPLNLYGQQVSHGDSFWCTGSHWPEDKSIYLENFFDTTISTINTMIAFNNLEKVCKEKNIDMLPLFDSYIWNILEKDLNAYVSGTPLPDRNFLNEPMTQHFSQILDRKFLDFIPLINWAIENNFPFYNEINKLHPPSNVHLSWMKTNIIPMLQEKFCCHELDSRFIKMINHLSEEWNSV